MERSTKKRKITYGWVEEIEEVVEKKEETFTAKQVEVMLKMVVQALREDTPKKPEKKLPPASYIS